MPQMFPLLWLNLFLMTLIMIFIMMSIIHTMKSNAKFKIMPNNIFLSKTWKW